MTLLTRIKSLANEKGLTLAALERSLDFSNGSISRWDKSSPSADKLQKVANFFNVTTDYLLGNPYSPDNQVYFRMNVEGLSKEDIEEVKSQLSFAEQLAKEAVKKRKQGGN